MSAYAAPTSSTASRLGMWDAVSIIVGIIVGASIYRSPWLIFSNLPETYTVPLVNYSFTAPAWASGLAVWGLVGILSLIGALCYAELGTAYPTSGGDYTYLTRAYGQGPGFLFAWSEMAIIRTGGSIAAMAYVFADYANRLYPLKNLPPSVDFLSAKPGLTYAAAAIVLLALINLIGLQPGRIVQNLLTVVKVLGLLGIIAAGFLYFLWPRTAESVVPAEAPIFPPGGLDLGFALVLVFYAYGGWNEAAYVAGELRDRRRSVVLSLMLGVGLVTVIYMAVNGAYLMGLGAGRVRASHTVAADLMQLPLGEPGEKVISALIMLSALGAINGLLFTGIRLYSTFGSHERLFSGLAPGQGRAPIGAIFVQVLFSVGLMALFEFGDRWKPWVEAQFGRVGIGMPENFSKPAGGFDDIVACTAPVFWLFFTATGYSLIVLRSRDRTTERPFKVPVYPILPMIFCASSLFMLYRSTTWAYKQGPAELMTVALLVLLGIPLYALSGPTEPRRW